MDVPSHSCSEPKFSWRGMLLILFRALRQTPLLGGGQDSVIDPIKGKGLLNLATVTVSKNLVKRNLSELFD